MYITITGELGSGKSTIAKLIEEKHNFMLYSTGTIQREIAKEKGITTLELNQQMTNDLDNEYDKMIDNKTKEIDMRYRNQNVIFDSRMAWHFVESSFKVYVVVDIYTAAKRVKLAGRGSEEQYNDISEAAAALLKRKQLEDKRFAELYSVQTTNYNNYDLVIDSTDVTAEYLAGLILEQAESAEEKTRIFLSPKRLYPTKAIKNIDSEYVKEIQDKAFEKEIDVMLYDGNYYIVDGHHRVCASLQRNMGLVGVRIVNVDNNDLVSNKEEIYRDWEDFNSMKFAAYPNI